MIYARDGSLQRQFQYHPVLVGRMSSHIRAARPAAHYTYNDAGKVIGQQREGAQSYRFDYAQDRTTVTDSLGRQRIYHLEGKGGLQRVVRLQREDGSSTHGRFDSSAGLTASVDALGRETRYELDVATGALLGITGPDGQQTRFGYNELGQTLHSIRASGARDEYTYDARARLASTTDALGLTTRHPDGWTTASPTTANTSTNTTAGATHARNTETEGKEMMKATDKAGVTTAPTLCTANSTNTTTTATIA